MITPAEIQVKARQKYSRLLQAWLADDLPAQFPLLIPSNKGSLTTAPAQRTEQLRQLRMGSREGRGFGYTVHWQTVRSARHGEQGVPMRIELASLEDYLRLCGLTTDFQIFTEQAQLIRQHEPALTAWLARHPEKVVPHAGQWPALLRVCAYFRQHPLPGVYARQVPGVHSKFVEQHTGILDSLLTHLLPTEHRRAAPDFATRFGLQTDPPAVRFRLLDVALAAFFGGLTDITVPQPDFERLTLPTSPLRVLVVENKLTFLTLPPLPATLAIWGSGYSLERLRACQWLCAASLYYWGDLDLHGFHILAQLRGYFLHTESVLMDAKTYQAHPEHLHGGTIPEHGPPDLLTPGEQQVYQVLRTNPQKNRLEQEHISHEYIVQILQQRLR